MYLNTAIALVICFVYLDIPGYIFVLDSAILPKYFYYVLFVIVAPFLLLKFREFILYMASPYALWVFAVIIIYSLDILDGNEAVDVLIKDVDISLILSLVFGFTVSIARTESYERLFPLLAAIIPICTLIDFVSPGIFYPIGTELSVLGRASAMYINPTRAGEAILLTCILAIPAMRMEYRMPLLLLAGAGVIVTFSRGPILIWMLFCFFLLISHKIPKSSFIFPIVISAILPLLLVGFKSYLQGRQDLDLGLDNILGRLDFFQTRSLEDDSAQERFEVLEAGWRIFLENPIFGAGTGATTLWSHRSSTHNQFFMVGAEHGIVGIFLWLWLIVIVWRGNYFQDNRFQRAVAAGIFLFSFFNHNMLTTLYWLISSALVSGRRQP
jgi:O-antigen ligase